VESLASATEEEVLGHWAGLGYYSRARNVHRAAQAIVEAGRFPRNREEWENIPGVGPYTAGAILSIASDEPEAILDGNVERVLSRWHRVTRAGGDAAYKAKLWELSGRFVREAQASGVRPSVTNQALMELGALICTPRKPQCGLCPVASFCEAQKAEEQEKFPPPKKPKEWVKIQEKLHCLIDADFRVLLRKRAAGEWRQGLWDLPHFKPKGLKTRHVGEMETRHVVTRHKITRLTEVWKAESGWRAAESEADGEMRWISMDKPEVPVGSALVKTLSRIRERFSEFERSGSSPGAESSR
jgi:A/G-specific adenine glycosylase